jgi:RND family efflux transporter MFP subunit
MVQVGGGGAGTLEFPGEIRPARQADMGFEVAGKIVAFPAQEGQRVDEGTVLARLDPRDYDSELAKQRAQLDKTRTDLERYRTLYDEGVSPRAEFERAQRNYEAAQANYQQAAKAVEDTELRAPFDGVVARKLVEDFVNVQAKETVLILQDDSSLEIRVSVPERDFARMETGLSLEERSRRARPRVVVSALGDRVFPARVTELSTTADPQTRTYQARFAFENPPDVNVLPGMTARVVVDVGGAAASGRPATTLPVQAVTADPEGEPFVWVVDPETLQVSRAPVGLGAMAGDRVEIVRGLEPGQTVATSGVAELREGMTVRRFER